jgi:ribonuclease P protein subunit POP4
MITARNIIKHELIGLEVEVKGKNVKGVVIDETKNMLIIKKGKRKLHFPKENNIFIFKLKSEFIEVNGKLLKGRPEERLKNNLPKKWGYLK